MSRYNYGYARASTDPQVLSIPVQEARIEAKALSMEGTFGGTFSETASALYVPWSERPQFKALLNELKRGDCLIVWKMSRIDRDFFRSIKLMEWARARDVRLCILDCGGMELDMNTAMGRTFATMMIGFMDMEQEGRIESVRGGMRPIIEAGYAIGMSGFCKGQGEGAGGKWWKRMRAPLGRKPVAVQVGPELKPRRASVSPAGTYMRVRYVWDSYECNLIREAYVRHFFLGHTDYMIGQDFVTRGELTPKGDPWVRTYKRNKYPSQQMDPRRIKKAYTFLADMIDSGNVMPPELEITEVVVEAILEKIQDVAAHPRTQVSIKEWVEKHRPPTDAFSGDSSEPQP